MTTPPDTEIEATIDELRRLVTGIGYIGDCPPAVRDRILATGERLSAPIVAAALRAMGHRPCRRARPRLIRHRLRRTGRPKSIRQSPTIWLVRRLIDACETSIPVVTGFIGADRRRQPTTLGRGGSDLTATVLGAVLDAERVEIWTDVNGIFTAPPRIVAGARPQPYVSYDEAAEMARVRRCGALFQDHCPDAGVGIPVVVRNTFDPVARSTWVGREPDVPAGARSLASVEHAAVFKVRSIAGDGNAAGAVAVIAERCLIAAMAAASGEWTLVAAENDAESLDRQLRARGLEVELIKGTSVVTVIGSRLLQQPWVAGRALEALGRRNIALQGLVSPSEHAFCVVVDHTDHDRSLAILHEALMLPHLADRAADAARRAAHQKGDDNGPTPVHSSRYRRDRDCRAAARPPAA